MDDDDDDDDDDRDLRDVPFFNYYVKPPSVLSAASAAL